MASGRYDYTAAGRAIEPAPVGAWRRFDIADPDPGYFEFDWLSARHPDLYDRFALSTDGLMEALSGLVDLAGLLVCDVGAGTGRSAIGAAAKAEQVIAIDLFDSVVRYGNARLRAVGVANVLYVSGDSARLPLPDNSLDVVMSAWAVLNWQEALRVARPGGWIIQMGSAPGAIAGELTALLAEDYPMLVGPTPAPREWFAPDCPPEDFAEPMPGARFVDGVRRVHDFTHTSRYESADDLAAIVGRLYGPRAAEYMRKREQATLTWRLRINYAQVAA